MEIYVPKDNTYNKCYVVQNENTIRAYNIKPTQNTTYNYRDYYINSNYIYKDGSGQWTQYTTTLPICLNENEITNNIMKRNDMNIIIPLVIIIFMLAIIIINKITNNLFRGSL